MPRTHRLRNVRRLIRWIEGGIARLVDGVDYSHWRTAEAEVYSSDSRLHGFDVGTEIWYTYHVLEESWSGSCWVRFFDGASSRYYATRHPAGSKVVIRYNPAVPSQSVMLEQDQPDAYPVAVAMQNRWRTP